jgi:hypothetical protein
MGGRPSHVDGPVSRVSQFWASALSMRKNSRNIGDASDHYRDLPDPGPGTSGTRLISEYRRHTVGFLGSWWKEQGGPNSNADLQLVRQPPKTWGGE